MNEKKRTREKEKAKYCFIIVILKLIRIFFPRPEKYL